jgi:Putative peptidoglycan binding domain
MASDPEPTKPTQLTQRSVIEPTMVFDSRTGSWVDDLALLQDSGPPPRGGERFGAAPASEEVQTQEMDPVEAAAPRERSRPRPARPGVRTVVVAVAASAAGFGLAALLLYFPGATGPPSDDARQPGPPTSAAAPPPEEQQPPEQLPEAPEPGGSGALREGDSGQEVTDLQQRLLRIPDVYREGQVNGEYDTTLTQAVSRYQVWYGIRGDEQGVYGDNTRRDLESRT